MVSVFYVSHLTAADPVAPAKKTICFQTGFEGETGFEGWTGKPVKAAGFNSAQSLYVDVPAGGTERSHTFSRSLSVESMRGCMIRGSMMLKTENIGKKPSSWNGVKFMLSVETPSSKLWPQAEISTTNQDWKRIAFTARIPQEATKITLVLGLEEVAGKAWFDDVSIAIVKTTPVVAARAEAGPMWKGHELPRLRGAMIAPRSLSHEDLQVLGGQWNANLIRWQLIRSGGNKTQNTQQDYDRWLESELQRLDAALPQCEQLGIKVVVDLHSPPGGEAISGGYYAANGRFFSDPECQKQFVEVWSKMALRYKNAKPIWGFDLVNEPVEDFIEEGCDDWPGLAERAARTVRAVDPQRTLIVEPASWGGPEGFAGFQPLPFSNIVYSVHMYVPHAFTHQGVNSQGRSYEYPGKIEGRSWDKAQLEAALQPVIDFQKTYGVHIYVGEFSAIRWAPNSSACRYLSDVIDIFEAHGWDWSYHAFREWDGWSVEHGPDRMNRTRSATPTDRQQLLCDWFSKNKKEQ